MLAIVIPYYKITFFEQTLQSLADQTDKRFKVYIGNDNSPENPESLLQQYRGKFDFVYREFEQNLGSTSLVAQWERCIALTQNESWLMILGDDDYLHPDLVASWYEHYPVFASKSQVVRFASQVVDEHNKPLSNIYTHKPWQDAGDAYYKRFKGLSRSSLSEHIFLKQAYQRNAFVPYPLAWHSDDRAWLDFTESLPLYSISDVWVNIRMSGINISGQQDNQWAKNQATYLFLKDILTLKRALFSPLQILDLSMSLEQTVKRNRKLSADEWFFLLRIYLTYPRLIPLLKFFRRLLKAIFMS